MGKRSVLTVSVDSQGGVLLPPALIKKYGLKPGAQIRVTEDGAGLCLSHSSDSLARVYVEPTTRCNLDCRTCMRHAWEEPLGSMTLETFARVLDGVSSFDPLPQVFFGGYGEPLAHPQLMKMVALARERGAQVELITNGILLGEESARQLIELGVERIWVSLDGSTPESYADVRLGAALPEIIANLERLRFLRGTTPGRAPRLGIAFVAMRRNLHDLPQVVRLGQRLGADQFSITNVLAHTPELAGEVLYRRSMNEEAAVSEWSPLLGLPRMDINAQTLQHLLVTLEQTPLVSVARQRIRAGANTCPFVERASLSVRWDGTVSPCLALLHRHESYLDAHVRQTMACSLGSLSSGSLREIWESADYRALRERLLAFDFSPCTLCNSCDMVDSNREDCFGNLLPACGGCLWAQGFIQCP